MDSLANARARRIKGADIQGQLTSLASDDYNGLLRCRAYCRTDIVSETVS
ncbi:MAG: hypothetical protein RBS45_02790 [Anaerolineales bacterium]|nr:hypothetical protein [Anaerolineales bacterium]